MFFSNKKHLFSFLLLAIFSFSFIQPSQAIANPTAQPTTPFDPPSPTEALPYNPPPDSTDLQVHLPLAADSADDEEEVIAAGAFSSCAGVAQIPTTECDALVALYTSTNGGSWVDHTNWLQTDEPCGWYGVTCDAGHISEINFWDNNLSGSIPTTLDDLTYLTLLDLSENQLTGSIPAELGNLSDLYYLHLGHNQLTGTIPNNLQNLSELTIISLAANQLTGQIPTWFGSLNKLESLWLWDNQLTGTIPEELGNLSDLINLCLGGNDLSGEIPGELGDLNSLLNLQIQLNTFTGSIPVELGRLSNLTDLFLNDNQLSGNIPAELQNLTQLERLSLSGNSLNGNIPSWIGDLSNLYYLDLHVNNFSGNIPNELQNLTLLEYLTLSTNSLDGNIPSWIGNFSNLYYLGLVNNQFSGEIPETLYDLTNLEQLYLGNSSLSGQISPKIGQLTKLKWLSISNSQINGAIPDQIGILADLEYLYLNSNALSGGFNPALGSLSNLWYLNLSNNQLTGNIPPEIGSLTNMYYLYFHHNQLSGEVPFEFTYLTNLYTLDIGYNYLSSSNPTVIAFLNTKDPDWAVTQQTLPFSCSNVSGISQSECEALVTLYNGTNGPNWRDNTDWLETNTPCEWYGITCGSGHVSHLTLMNNNLSGPIPAELTDLTELGYLGLYNNHLTGQIPPQLGSMTEVFAFYLYGNELTGSIPEELGDLPIVRWIDLSDNQLSGEIPSSLGNFGAFFQILNLSHNNLTGSIPTTLGDLPTDTLWLYLNDNQLTGSIPDSLGNITELEILDLSNNQLSGEIPASIGNYTIIETLKLQHNHLRGEVPSTIVNLSTLTNLDIGYNHLYSSLPAVIAFLNAKDPDWAKTQQLLPPKVDDLKTTPGSAGNLNLRWTVPDSNTPGSAPFTSYVIRYSEQSVTEASGEENWWNTASALAKDLKASSWGYHTNNLGTGKRYYYGIRTVTANGILSPLSNVPSLYDIGFRPDPDGYNFKNYESTLSDAKEEFTVDDMRRMFGDDSVCLFITSDTCTPNPSAWTWWLKTNNNGGHCFGMATSSANFYRDNGLLSQFGAQSTYSDLFKTDMNVRRYLAYYQILQNAQEVASIINSAEEDSLNNNLEKIYSSTDPMQIAYRYVKDSGEKSAHAVTPFAVEQISDTEFVIWIYDNDNEYPDYEEITINLEDSSWSYPYGTEEKFAVIEPPRPKAEGEFYTAPWDSAATSTTVSSIGESQILVTNSLGEKIGYENGVFVNEIADAFEYVPFTEAAGEPSVYYLPTNDAYTITLDGQDLTETEAASLAQFGPGFAVSVDALAVSPDAESQVAVAADGSQVELLAGEDQSEAELSLALESADHSTSFSVTGAEVSNGAAVSLSADAETGTMVYENGSGDSGNYQPRVTRVGEHGYQFFVNRSVEISPNAAHAYDTASWFGPEAMTVRMDQNGDGTFETTTQVENDASYLFFPLVTEKRPATEDPEPDAGEAQQAEPNAEPPAAQIIAPTAEPTQATPAAPTTIPTAAQPKPAPTSTEPPAQPIFQTDLGDYQLAVLSADTATPEQFKAEPRGDAIILENSGPNATFTLEVATLQAPVARHTLKMKTGQVYTLRLSNQGKTHTLRIEQEDGSMQNIPLSGRAVLPIPVSIVAGMLAALLLTAWLVFRRR